MLIFDRRKGTITTEDGHLISKGIWSGFGDAANDPLREHDAGKGPIPQGIWIFGAPYQHRSLGPFVMNLDPAPGTDPLGRSLFRIHGDNSTPDPHDASHGCIIAPYSIRVRINQETDRRIKVV